MSPFRSPSKLDDVGVDPGVECGFQGLIKFVHALYRCGLGRIGKEKVCCARLFGRRAIKGVFALLDRWIGKAQWKGRTKGLARDCQSRR